MPDMWSALAHGDGKLILMVPARAGTDGIDLAKPDSFFTRHRDSGQMAAVMSGTVYLTGEASIVALRTFTPANLAMDKPLVLAVARDLPNVFAAWRRDALLRAGVFGVLLLVAGLSLLLYQKRQRTYRRLAVDQEAARLRAQVALRESKQRYDNLASRIPVGIYLLRSTPEVAFALDYASPRMAELLDLDPARLLADAHAVVQAIHPDDRDAFAKLNLEGIQHRRPFDWTGRVPVGGTIRWLHFASSPELQEDGDVLWFGLVADVTEHKQMEDHVRQLAFHDALTQLPNRRLLNDRLSQTLAASKRSACHGALMFLDLDNFKLLNDTHGHAVGDLLLMAAAERLRTCVREMDTVARFGGDEFVVMISELDVDRSTSVAQARGIAEKIRAALAKPYALKLQHAGNAKATVEHQCGASIGVALFSGHETSQDDILKRADAAMYRAKEEGCNLIRFHDLRN
jgi:diguanylate cyclase (GGDEF)-like protein/PAS domain S-box-containing protein